MADFAYFLGCIMNNRYPGIEKSSRMLFEKFGMTLNDMKGASCCPAPGVFGSFDKTSWLTIAARNITIAEDMGMDIITECNGCFGTLFETNYELKEDEAAKAKVNEILSEVGREYKGDINVRHFAEVLYNDVGLDKIAAAVTNPLDGLNVAVHYGCHFLRPTKDVQIDNAEKPTILDEIVEATGAKSVEYRDKMQCCGAGGGVRSRDLDVALDYTKDKLTNMEAAGADAIINVCPFCHLQFDVGQKEIKKTFGDEFNIPVFHLAQFLGLAMGYSPEDLTVDVHQVCVDSALEKCSMEEIEKLDKMTGGE